MSRENLAAFLTKAYGDQTLGQLLLDQSNVEDLISLGTKEGFEFSAEDLDMLLRREGALGGELSDEELESVAGGGNVMSAIYGVFRASVKDTNEDVDYWKKKLGL